MPFNRLFTIKRKVSAQSQTKRNKNYARQIQQNENNAKQSALNHEVDLRVKYYKQSTEKNIFINKDFPELYKFFSTNNDHVKDVEIANKIANNLYKKLLAIPNFRSYITNIEGKNGFYKQNKFQYIKDYALMNIKNLIYVNMFYEQFLENNHSHNSHNSHNSYNSHNSHHSHRYYKK